MQNKYWGLLALLFIIGGIVGMVANNEPKERAPVYVGDLKDLPYVKTLSGTGIVMGLGMILGFAAHAFGRHAMTVAGLVLIAMIAMTQVANFAPIGRLTEIMLAYGGLNVSASLGILGITAVGVFSQAK